MVDHNKIRALKQRRGVFEAHGQSEKVKAVDAEIAKLRAAAEPEPDPEPEPERKAEPVVETGEADLTGVETAALPRRRGRPPKARPSS